MEPRLQLLLELLAAARRNDTPNQLPPLDDADRRHLSDAELLGEVEPPIDRHAHKVERVVVAAPLQHLGDESLDPPATAGLR